MKISSVNNLSSKILSTKKRLAPKNEVTIQRILPKATNQEDIVLAKSQQKNWASCGWLSDSCGGSFDFCGSFA